MDTTVNFEGKVCTVTISGRIDTLTAPELENIFNDIEPKADKIIFDMTEVQYISSAGLRALIVAHRAMSNKDGLILKGLNKNVKTIITLTGFDKQLNIEE